MLTERLNVAIGAFNSGDQFGVGVVLADGVCEIEQRAMQGCCRFNRARCDIAKLADAAQHIFEPAASACCGASLPKDLRGQRFNLILNFLDQVGLPLNDCFEQSCHHMCAGHAPVPIAAGTLREKPKGLGFCVAHGDQAVTGENERHVGRGDMLGVARVDHEGRHEVSAVFTVVAVRHFDLAHFGACWNIESENFLNIEFFVVCRIEQINPHSCALHICSPVALDQASAGSIINCDHGGKSSKQ